MRYPISIARRHGAALLDQVPQVVVGTIHSVKGGEADSVYLLSRSFARRRRSSAGRFARLRRRSSPPRLRRHDAGERETIDYETCEPPNGYGDMKERTIQREIVRKIEKMGGYAVKQHGSIYGRVGTPDILACVGGVFFAIEVKVPGPPSKTKATPAQNRQLRMVAIAGGVAFVTTSVEHVERVIKEHTDPQT